MSEVGSHRVAENIHFHSRLVESALSVEWKLENVVRFESKMAGLTFESPVFGPKNGGFKWQLVMNPRDACSSSLSLHLHKSSPSKRASVDYCFGFVNTEGHLEFEDRGQMNLELDAPRQHPTILFSWTQMLEMKHKLFVNDCLRIQCQITTLDFETVHY